MRISSLMKIGYWKLSFLWYLFNKRLSYSLRCRHICGMYEIKAMFKLLLVFDRRFQQLKHFYCITKCGQLSGKFLAECDCCLHGGIPWKIAFSWPAKSWKSPGILIMPGCMNSYPARHALHRVMFAVEWYGWHQSYHDHLQYFKKPCTIFLWILQILHSTTWYISELE